MNIHEVYFLSLWLYSMGIAFGEAINHYDMPLITLLGFISTLLVVRFAFFLKHRMED